MNAPAGRPEPDGERPIVFYAIYDRPRDYPEHFVLRGWAVTVGGMSAALKPCFLFPSLEEARMPLIAAGLRNLGRDDDDEPQLVESWI